MACKPREMFGRCGHDQCPLPEESGYLCVEICGQFCECGDGCHDEGISCEFAFGPDKAEAARQAVLARYPDDPPPEPEQEAEAEPEASEREPLAQAKELVEKAAQIYAEQNDMEAAWALRGFVDAMTMPPSAVATDGAGGYLEAYNAGVHAFRVAVGTDA